MQIDTPTHRTKTTPAQNIDGVASLVTGGDIFPTRTEYAYSYPVGASEIFYQRGPQRINMAGRIVNHWKTCEHKIAKARKQPVYNFKVDTLNRRSGQSWYNAAYNVPVAWWSSFGLGSNYVDYPSPVIVDELMSEVYADIAGRANDSLLLLEDFAGFFSGKSIWKSIGGVANATQGVARAISTASKLGKAFGYKNSLYSMWLSSKEAVRQAIGLRLGYRFSFKTTLNDIAKAVDFGYGFGQYLQQMQNRNSRRVLRYEKNAQNINNVDQDLTSTDVLGKLFTAAPDINFKRWFYSPISAPSSYYDSLPGGKISRSAVFKATAWAYASVHYPMEYLTMKHYLEGRFGLNKPLTTLWAIVPLSFVVDYLFNVQDALSYVDNKLNDYLVSTCVQKVWTAKTVFRQNTLDIPERSISYNYRNEPYIQAQVQLPHISLTYVDTLDYVRMPGTTDQISASLPPLIAADETNWTTSIGTGLELLSQSRLR